MALVRTISRRELNHQLAKVLDQVIDTGEPVEVVTRGGRPLVISRKAETKFEAWVRQGLVNDFPADLSVLDDLRPADTGRSTESILADVRDNR
jgi:hypothetical protein